MPSSVPLLAATSAMCSGGLDWGTLRWAILAVALVVTYTYLSREMPHERALRLRSEAAGCTVKGTEWQRCLLRDALHHPRLLQHARSKNAATLLLRCKSLVPPIPYPEYPVSTGRRLVLQVGAVCPAPQHGGLRASDSDQKGRRVARSCSSHMVLTQYSYSGWHAGAALTWYLHSTHTAGGTQVQLSHGTHTVLMQRVARRCSSRIASRRSWEPSAGTCRRALWSVLTVYLWPP